MLWLVDVVIIVIVVVVDEVVVVFICGAGLQRRPEDANVYALFFFCIFFLCYRLLSSLSRGVAAKAIRKTPATCVCVSDQYGGAGKERDH